MTFKINLKTLKLSLACGLFACSLIFLSFLYLEKNDSDKQYNCTLDLSAKYYYQLDESRAPSPEELWVESYIQPLVLGFEEKEDINYIVGGLPANDGKCEIVRFVISGSIPVETNAVLLNQYKDTQWLLERVDFSELQKRIKIGSQVRIKYLVSSPNRSDLTDELCTKYPTVSDRLCTIQKINEDFIGNRTAAPINADNIGEFDYIYGSSVDQQVINIQE